MTTIKEYLETYELCIREVEDDDLIGITTATIQGFESYTKASNKKFRITILLPWGEEHNYTEYVSNLHKDNNTLPIICDSLGIQLSQFEQTKGREITVGIKKFKLTTDDEINSSSRINREITC